jgi:hypothetical protein
MPGTYALRIRDSANADDRRWRARLTQLARGVARTEEGGAGWRTEVPFHGEFCACWVAPGGWGAVTVMRQGTGKEEMSTTITTVMTMKIITKGRRTDEWIYRI